MDHHIKDVSGTPAFHANRPPLVVKREVSPKDEKHPPLELSEPVGETEPPDEAIPLGELDLTLRRAVNSADQLRVFLGELAKANKEKTAHGLMQLVATCDPDTDGLVNRGLDLAVSRSGADLVPALFEMLKTTINTSEKAIIARVLVSSTRGRNLFINDYMIPVLDGRLYIDNSPSDPDESFCTSVLNGMKGDDLREFLKEMDFSLVYDVDNFAFSLSKVNAKKVLLETLVEIARDASSVSFGDKKEEAQTHIQRITLKVMQKLDKRSIQIPLEPLKDLYKEALDDELIGNEAASLLKSHPENKNAREAFLEFIQDEDNTDDLAVRRRFRAIGDYVDLLKEKAGEGLKNFILTSDNSYLVNYATLKLAEACGDKGRIALLEAIYTQAKEGKPSIPFAFICKMLDLGKNIAYLELVKKLCSMDYPEDRGIAELFINNNDFTYSKVRKGEKGELLFYRHDTEDIITLLEFIRKIGISNLALWAIGDKEGDSSTNIEKIITSAKRINEKLVTSMIAGALAVESSVAIRRSLLRLGNMRSLANSDVRLKDLP